MQFACGDINMCFFMFIFFLWWLLLFRVHYKGTTLFHYVEDIAELFIDCCDVLTIKPGAYSCNIKGNTLSVDEFLKILYTKCPNGEQLITTSDNAIILPFPDSMKQETLNELFTFDKNTIDLRKTKGLNLKGTQVTPVMDAIFRTVELFEQLKNENRLHDNDLKG